MITFKKLRYKNFLSTGNTFTEIDFPPSPLTSAIGLDAKTEWENNPELIPDGSMVKARLLKEEVVEIKEVKEGRHNDIKKYLLSGIALILLL